MELLSADLPLTHRIVFASDLHLGTLACYRKGWDNLIKEVAADPTCYLAFMGDAIEAIATDDPRFAAAVHDGKQTPLAQAEEFADTLKPIADRVLVVLTGNHEIKLGRYGDLTRYICTRAGVPYGGYSCKLAIRHNGKLLYKIYLTHGRWTFNSSADDALRRLSNKRLAVKRKLQHLAGDCAIMGCGHSHGLLTVDPEHELYLTDNGTHLSAQYTRGVQTDKYIPPGARWYFNSGSFLKNAVVGVTTYSEQAGYQPLQMGFTMAQVTDGIVQGLSETRIG